MTCQPIRDSQHIAHHQIHVCEKYWRGLGQQEILRLISIFWSKTILGRKSGAVFEIVQ